MYNAVIVQYDEAFQITTEWENISPSFNRTADQLIQKSNLNGLNEKLFVYRHGEDIINLTSSLGKQWEVLTYNPWLYTYICTDICAHGCVGLSEVADWGGFVHSWFIVGRGAYGKNQKMNWMTDYSVLASI